MSHLTGYCKHSETDWCEHCKEGCNDCGSLEDLNDDGYCERCSFERACCAADAIHDRMKDGD